MMTTILTVNPSAKIGGGTVISNSINICLSKENFHVFSFFPESGPATEELAQHKLITVLLPAKKNFFGIFFTLWKFLRNNDVSIVHAHGTRAAWWIKLVLLFIKFKPKFIYSIHGLHIIYRPWYQKRILLFLEKFSNRLVDVLICMSGTMRSDALHYNIIPKQRIILIPYGVDIEKITKSLPVKKLHLKIPADGLVIAAIQRLEYPKDVLTVLKAFSIISPVFPKAFLLIIGSGSLESVLKEECRTLQGKERILFLGDRHDVFNLLQICDVVILSSHHEGLGLSLLEGMAAKKTVIGTDVPGICEIVENERNGFLVKVGDSVVMAERMKQLLENPKLRNRMGELGFELVAKNFTLENMINAHAILYRDLVKY